MWPHFSKWDVLRRVFFIEAIALPILEIQSLEIREQIKNVFSILLAVSKCVIMHMENFELRQAVQLPNVGDCWDVVVVEGQEGEVGGVWKFFEIFAFEPE